MSQIGLLSEKCVCVMYIFVFIYTHVFACMCTRHIQFSSVAQLCPTIWDPVEYSMPGFPVFHQLPELAQTHVHLVGDAIQPSHPLSSPSPAFNLSQHQGLFQWVSSSHHVAKVLALEKAMATHSSVPAWRIPGTGEPGGLPSMGSHRVGHNWSNLAAAAAAEHLKEG